MMGVAAGMGMSGLRPIVYTIAPFTTTRCLEQIRIDVAYHKSPVIIVGTGSGLSYAGLGPTHHSLEDFAILKSIPNLQILAPWDSPSLRSLIHQAIASNLPTYIRIGKKGEKDISTQENVPEIGRSLQFRKGGDVCIVAVGTIAQESIDAALQLESKGIQVEVMLTHTVKPIPFEQFEDILSRHNIIVVIEEHSRIGGFGESMQAFVASKSLKRKIVSLGVGDKFLPTIGSQAYARKYFEISACSIVSTILSLLK
jgi:transketolase